MPVENKIITILADIMDLPEEEITAETYLIRDLGAESVDLLELSVTIADQLNVAIEDALLFLTHLRNHADTKKGEEDPLKKHYPFLEQNRIDEIRADLENGPVLKVKDMTAYLKDKVNDTEIGAENVPQTEA